MDDTLKTILAVWGALISTILAIKALITSALDKPRIRVSAELVFLSCNESDSTKGTKVYHEKSGWSEIRLQVKAANLGSKSLQIVSVYIVDDSESHQIFPERIPVVLEPRTQLKTTIQKEWIDNSKVCELGVLDALGKRHAIKALELKELMIKSNTLPSNKKKYRNNETGEEVEAFQSTDDAIVNSRL